MPKNKRKTKAPLSVKAKKTIIDTAIEERLAACARGEKDHIVYVGLLVENILKGDFGAILKALTAGRTSSELQANKDGKLSAERILGRLEAYDTLWHDLEQFVLDKDAMVRPIEEKERAPEHVASEPSPTL